MTNREHIHAMTDEEFVDAGFLAELSDTCEFCKMTAEECDKLGERERATHCRNSELAYLRAEHKEGEE